MPPIAARRIRERFSVLLEAGRQRDCEIILDFVTDNKYYFTGNILQAGAVPAMPVAPPVEVSGRTPFYFYADSVWTNRLTIAKIGGGS